MDYYYYYIIVEVEERTTCATPFRASMHPFFHRCLIAPSLFFTRGKMPKSKDHKEANNPKQPKNAGKKEGKAEEKGDSARTVLASKGNKSKASADKTRGSKNASNVTRKSELATKSDAPDEDDESVTVSVDNVDMEEVEDKKKSKKKEKAGPKKMLSLGQPSKLVGDAYSELAHDYHNVFEREMRDLHSFHELLSCLR